MGSATFARSGMFRGLALVGAALACVAVGTGCGDSDDEGGAATTGGSSTASAGAEPKKEVSVAMAQTASSIPSFLQARQGAEAAAADDGSIKLTVRGPASPSGTAEAQIAQQMLAADPDGFAPSPCILPAWTRVLKAGQTQTDGNTVAWSCKPVARPEDESPVTTFIGSNHRQVGRTIASLTIKEGGLKPDATGTALVGNCFVGTPALDDAVDGYIEGLKKEVPNLKVVKFGGSVDQGKNTATWTSQLQNNPDTVIAFGPCGPDATALATIKRKTGGKYAVGVQDPDVPTLRSLKSDIVTAGVFSGSWMQGYVTTALLAEGARGDALPEGWVNPGELVVTKANADELIQAESSPEARREYYTPLAKKLLAEARPNVKPLADSFE